jgi:DNA-binding NarL/FixJ family response regulator
MTLPVADGPADRDVRASAPSPPETTSPTSAAFNLTSRETEVLDLLARGLTYAQIGEALVISPRTVDAHVRAIFGKLGVRSRTAATRVALQHGLV